MLFIALCYLNFILTVSRSNKKCFDAWECESQELSGDVLCFGYQSCQSSSITSTSYIPCAGYKSCTNSKILSMDTIACDGDYACSNAQLSSSGIYVNQLVRHNNTKHGQKSSHLFISKPQHKCSA